ncbi:MAG: hypothetical protein PVG87_26320 [Desulfobacteraceae bacterium]|jgi:hypothetical protein
MVDHIHFQKISPSLSNTHRVKRTDQKNREPPHQHAFKKFLKQEGDTETESSEDRRNKKKSKDLNPTPANSRSVSNFDTASEDGKSITENYHGRRIDVHA